MRAVLSIVIVSSIIGSGCASRPYYIPLQASSRDFQALVGTWSGSYRISDRRHGLIDFRLDATTGSAFGDVFMIANGADDPYARFRGMPPVPGRRIAGDQNQVLSIRFVTAEDGRIQGTLTPYWDPDRGCEALATFYGTIHTSTIDGTFVSVCEAGVPSWEGRWRITRQRR